MKLIKITNEGSKYVEKARRRGEKDLQMLVSKNLKTVFNTNFAGMEAWIDFSNTSINHKGRKPIDGRIDGVGLTDKGALVLLEFKERESKHILSQTLTYGCWALFKPESVKKYVEFQKEKGILNKNLEFDVNYKPKLIMIAESYDIFDHAVASMIRDDVEVYFKAYELFGEKNQRMLHIFDAAEMPWVYNKVKFSRGNKSYLPSDNIGSLDGFYLEENEVLVAAKQTKVNNLPLALETILYKHGKKLFMVDEILKPFTLKKDITQLVGVENNGRASFIFHSDSKEDMLEEYLDLAKWTAKRLTKINGKEINKKRKDHMLVPVYSRNLTQKEKDDIQDFEMEHLHNSNKENNHYIYRPRWLSAFKNEEDYYLFSGKPTLHSKLHTYPGISNVYSLDYYTREFEDKTMVSVFNELRKTITDIAKESEERMYAKRGISYKCPKKFIEIQPRKKFISVKLYGNVSSESLPEHMKILEDNRFRIYNTQDIKDSLWVIKEAYEASKNE